MRYRLRTLLILLAIGPPVLAGAYWKAVERWRQYQFDQLVELIRTIKPTTGELVDTSSADETEPSD